MPYFDAASSAPLHPVARQALQASLDEGWADPARLYREGRRARVLLDAAREAAAEAVGCRPDELVFTSSGTRAVLLYTS
ncbi:aminotransferase class V-fold PLP-dependent enzyme, partial [Streptomyces cahuitamycinicus]